MSALKPLRMVRGKGESLVTYYNCGIVEQAREEGRGILIAKRNKNTGKMGLIVDNDVRMLHRPDFLGVFNDAHPKAGEGKYVKRAAFASDRVHGAQHVTPYLHDNRPYATAIEVFKEKIGKAKLSKMCAIIAHTYADSDHLLWEGRRGKDNCVVASEWMSKAEIWAAACKLNPKLLSRLRQSKSRRRDALLHQKARAKFFTDLDVLRRARCMVNARTGERNEGCGGKSPYALPLEQAGFAIDKFFLTYDVKDGEEMAQTYYRLVIGRREPYTLKEADWWYETTNSTVAYLNDKVRQKARRAKAKK